jgi:hypothetical protein
MDKGVKMKEIKKTTLHPDNQPNTDLYPKTTADQVEGLNNIITGINNEIEKKVNTVDNFVRIFTIPNGVNSGTLTADVKEKLCNPDGHNYYVYDDTSEMILKYSFNSDNEIIQYKAVYFQINKGYEITMQISPLNSSWIRSQTVLNVPASAGGKLYLHSLYFTSVKNQSLLSFYHTSPTQVTDEWIYENLTSNNCCITFFPTVTSISQYNTIGLSAQLGTTSSSPSWGTLIDLESPSSITLSVSQADVYTVTEL